ncbi:carbamate kinase [Fervidicoccus fontis]|uniref:Carbamate kinase n=1 Tax=Fervidicoccus fontis (strain DSM 19380 / JCM 18336 / VKM B-2539 / Kam940) TaxID=1163730 RepID=I0A1M1_FERFK|nr:carbamate kinase [Fervidicoccus fontis]AFH42878.1 carbamate kinase-like carbamoyl phosphate synthetase [Fervidicoccus fontis Kam940]
MFKKDGQLIVIALGGNAFLQKGEKGTVEEQWKNVYVAAKEIVGLIKRGYKVVVTHGNGPQVGNVMEWIEALKDKIPPLTMDIAGAMTQGWIGYMLQQAIQNVLIEEGLDHHYRAVTLINQVIVKKDDPAWNNPTKYVGPYYYNEEEIEKLKKERGWVIKPDPRGGYRRVVASPDVVDNVEKEAIKLLYENDFIVIASGGGGIPVVADEIGRLEGREAVIDKDLGGQLLASVVDADIFIILTDVEGAYINYGKPDQKLLKELKVSEAKKLLEQGIFGAGSMGPKVKAAIRFAEKTGKPAYIGHLYKLQDILEGKSGTKILPD